ncbi:MAG: hypothetical protein AAGC81_15110, partial [Pseudomonadota bacterium]
MISFKMGCKICCFFLLGAAASCAPSYDPNSPPVKFIMSEHGIVDVEKRELVGQVLQIDSPKKRAFLSAMRSPTWNEVYGRVTFPTERRALPMNIFYTQKHIGRMNEPFCQEEPSVLVTYPGKF